MQLKPKITNVLTTQPYSTTSFYIGISFCIAFLSFWLIKSLTYIPHDFSNSYFGAYFFLKGQLDVHIFDPYTFNKRIFEEGFKNVFVSYNPNPPIASMFFIPFALLPLSLAKLVFNIFSCLLLVVSIIRLCKHFNIEMGYIFMLTPIIFFIPIKNQILFGQTYFLVLFLIAEGYIQFDKRNTFFASLLWSVAILLKVFPAIIILFLLVRKEWKTLFGLSTVSLCLLAASFFFQGSEIWTVYLTEVLPKYNRGEINSAFISNYQSAHMLFKYAFIQHADLNSKPLVNSFFAFQTAEIIFKTFILTASSFVILSRKGLTSFGTLILASLLVSPYGSTYSNILLLILMIALSAEFTKKELYIAMILLFFISNLPLTIFNGLPPLFQFPRLILTIALFLSIFYFSKVKVNWKIPVLLIGVFSLQSLTIKDERDSTRLLGNANKHGLIFDYTIRNNYIVYQYWDEYGEHQHKTKVFVKTASNTGVMLKENQIYYNGTQLTNSSDTKLKPFVMNNNSIVYLSDKDRGIGFYNLRCIPI